MRVIRARAMGFCFGVRDALATVGQIAEPASVTILGQLAHNEQIQESLGLRGFATREKGDRQAIPATPTVVITAHGISGRDRRRLREAGKRLVDTTCPLVRRVHLFARQLEWQGYFVLVLGRRDHVEVQGITGDLTRFAVIETDADVGCYDAPRLGIVCQTTTRPADAERLVQAIRAKNPEKEVRYFDTICAPTRERQQAVLDLLRTVQALVVVGGRGSNNTLQLLRLAQDHGVPACHVQGAADLDPGWLSPFDVVGLTAGTSTPDAVIEEVHHALLSLACKEEAR